jgi:hypothetical protein
MQHRIKPPQKNNPFLEPAIAASQKPITHKLTLYIPVQIFDKVKMKALVQKRTMSEVFTELATKYLET